jgi:SAM-dependent methyltransferase
MASAEPSRQVDGDETSRVAIEGGACIEGLKAFSELAAQEVARVKRNLNSLSADDTDSLIRKPDVQVGAMEEAVATNTAFLERIRSVIQKHNPRNSTERGSRRSRHCGSHSNKLVQKLLQTFVREWSEEGLQERKECFERLLTTVDDHLGAQRDKAASDNSTRPRVLVPGCQLARLPFEISRRGYDCEGCEVRPLFFFGTQCIRHEFAKKGSATIQPYVLNTCNRMRPEDHVRRIPLPEVDVPELPPVRLGEFLQLYDTASSKGSFDAVVTAFDLDASPNVFRYIRTVAHVLKPGGIWVNFGPLAYNADHDEAHGQGVELSWEELKFAISHFFNIRDDEAFVDSFHASNAESMMQLQFSCIYFSAVRNGAEAEGIGQRT